MNIYVGNLSSGITEEELRLEFIIFGKVTSVTLMNDRGIGSGQRRECGFVEMPVENEGLAAIEQLQGKPLKGQPLMVVKALPITRNPYDPPGDKRAVGFNRKTRYRR